MEKSEIDLKRSKNESMKDKLAQECSHIHWRFKIWALESKLNTLYGGYKAEVLIKLIVCYAHLKSMKIRWF